MPKKLLTKYARVSIIAFVFNTYARVAQLVEHDLAKVGAAGSSPVSRSGKRDTSHDVSLFFVLLRSAPVGAEQRLK